MNYALKTLMNQSDLLAQEIVKVQKQYDEAEIELSIDIDLFETDLGNLKAQKQDLTDAIMLLNNLIK